MHRARRKGDVSLSRSAELVKFEAREYRRDLHLFRISGFGFWVSGFEFQVLGLGFLVSGFGLRVPGCTFRISDLGCRVWGLGFGVSYFVFRVSCFRLRVQGLDWHPATLLCQGRSDVSTGYVSRICLRHPETSDVKNVDFNILRSPLNGKFSKEYQLVRLAKLNKLSDWCQPTRTIPDFQGPEPPRAQKSNPQGVS